MNEVINWLPNLFSTFVWKKMSDKNYNILIWKEETCYLLDFVLFIFFIQNICILESMVFPLNLDRECESNLHTDCVNIIYCEYFN